MPSLTGFSDNAFATYLDFESAAITLLEAISKYQSKGGARIRLPVATGAHFDEIAAELEGYARPLWAVAALLVVNEGHIPDAVATLIEPYCQGIASGTDPDHPEYWGPIVMRDQRMVEMEIISYALLAAPDQFFERHESRIRSNIISWLSTINGKDLPTTNWLWFRVMTNLALVKTCGVPYNTVKQDMNSDLERLDTFYLGSGWSSDGPWTEDGKQADYYSGSFAIQFSQLLYVKYAREIDPIRCASFIQRAQEFSLAFWRYFDKNGAAIPFGRSLTYRFAFAGFWAAVAAAEISLPEPLHDLGVVKGLLLRHMRWWARRPDIFSVDGTLTIGFAYPNMFMCEDYNSPQSPYWCMKTFCALALSKNSPFWKAQEKPLPQPQCLAQAVEQSMHILCSTPCHHFLLSSGQYCPWPLKATEAKYGKFAYSSHFAFSVPTGSLIQQIAPDSSLALSLDNGETWKVRWIAQEPRISSVNIMRKTGEVERVPTLISSWKPWKNIDIEVETTLMAPTSEWPDWHVRVHRFKTNRTENLPLIQAVEGGFAIKDRSVHRGTALPRYASVDEITKCTHSEFALEGVIEQSSNVLICSDAGSSGIYCLQTQGASTYQAQALKPDSNTNLMWQRTSIPVIRSTLQCQKTSVATLTTGIFTAARTLEDPDVYSNYDVVEKWKKPPLALSAQLNHSLVLEQ